MSITCIFFFILKPTTVILKTIYLYDFLQYRIDIFIYLFFIFFIGLIIDVFLTFEANFERLYLDNCVHYTLPKGVHKSRLWYGLEPHKTGKKKHFVALDIQCQNDCVNVPPKKRTQIYVRLTVKPRPYVDLRPRIQILKA